MRFLVLADIDAFWWASGDGQADVLLSCGDVSDSLIPEAAKAWHCPTMLAVKGNHDSSAPFPEPIVDLHLKTVEVGGVTFGGFNGSWKYKPKGLFLYEQEEVRDALLTFPAVDIFVAHNAPKGIHDRQDEVHHGFEAFNEYIARARPRLFIHGHQHVNKETLVGGTRVIGVMGHKALNSEYRLCRLHNSPPEDGRKRRRPPSTEESL